jgi:cytochrome c-type biogenesis protein CcmH
MGNASPAKRKSLPPSAFRLSPWRPAAGAWPALLLVFVLSSAAIAGEATPAAADPALEERVIAVAQELRCLVCQNQTLADSNAPLAVDLRDQIRERMRQGASERAVVDYMVARYGDFVLYRPPLKATTVLLWTGPLLLAIVGLAALFLSLARRRRASRSELSDEERARAQRLLAGDGDMHSDSRPPGAENHPR